MYLKEQSTYRYHRTGVSQPTCGWKLSYRFLQYKESRISYKQTWFRELNACNYNTQITKVQGLCDNCVTLKIYNDDMQLKLHVEHSVIMIMMTATTTTLTKLMVTKNCLTSWFVHAFWWIITNNLVAPVVWRSDNAIHWINLYPVDNAIRFAITYPLDTDLSVE